MSAKRIPLSANLPLWQQKARCYPDSKGRGQRLNKYAIAVQYHLPPQTFEYRQKAGWPSLGGRSLDSVDMPYQPGKRFMEGTYLDTEVEDAMREPEEETKYARVGDELWPTVLTMAELLRVARNTLEGWDEDCPYLLGVNPDIFPEPGLNPKGDAFSPNCLQRCKAYRPGLAEAINAVREQTKRGGFVNRRPVDLGAGRDPVPPGTVWIDRKGVLGLLCPPWKLGNDAWKRVLRLIRKREIRAKRFGFLEYRPVGQAKMANGDTPKQSAIKQRRIAGQLPWCVKEDVERVRDWLRKRKREGHERLLPVAQTFNGVFPGNPQRWGVKLALNELNRELQGRGVKGRLTLATFRSWIRKTKRHANQRGLPADIRSAFIEAAKRIPGATQDEALTRLPSKKWRVPGSRVRAVSVLRADILALAEAIAAVEQAKADADYEQLKSADELCDHYGVPRPPDTFGKRGKVRWSPERAAVHAYLASLPLRRVRVRTEKCTRAVPKYDPAEVDRLLGGGNVLELALEAWPRLRVESGYGKAVLSALGDGWATVPEVQERLGEGALLGKKRTNSRLRIGALLECALGLRMVERDPPVSDPATRGGWDNGSPVVRWRKTIPSEQAPTAGNGSDSQVTAANAPAVDKPRWNSELRELWCGDRLLKKFNRHPADTQVALIEAFHRAGWAARIDNPFTTLGANGRTFHDNDKLRDVCKNLNRALPEGSIEFRRDGTGEGVTWHLR